MQREEGERGGARTVLSMIVLVGPRKYKSYCPTKKKLHLHSHPRHFVCASTTSSTASTFLHSPPSRLVRISRTDAHSTQQKAGCLLILAFSAGYVP